MYIRFEFLDLMEDVLGVLTFKLSNATQADLNVLPQSAHYTMAPSTFTLTRQTWVCISRFNGYVLGLLNFINCILLK